MTEPGNSASPTGTIGNKGPVVARIVLAVLLLIPGVIGLIAFSIILGLWLSADFAFAESDRMWMPLFIIPSVTLILFSVFSTGIVLRFARWKKAHLASLILSIVSIASIVLAHQLMLDSFSVDDTESPLWTLIAAIASLIAIALPPFLHWWFARPSDAPADPTGMR